MPHNFEYVDAICLLGKNSFSFFRVEVFYSLARFSTILNYISDERLFNRNVSFIYKTNFLSQSIQSVYSVV